MIKNYKELKHLLGCYFHQDMDLDYTSPDEALKDYVFNENEGINYILETLNEIKTLKSENYSSEQLWTMIENLGCEYRYDEYTAEGWLDYVADTIQKYLAEKQKLMQEKSKEDNGQKI